jgi:hypothetical protein
VADLRRARERLRRARRSYLAAPYTSVQLLLLAGAVLLGFGVVMAASTTISASLHADGGSGTMWTQLSKEVTFVALGLPVFWLGMRLTPRGYRLLVYPALIFAMMLLVAVLVPHIGIAAGMGGIPGIGPIGPGIGPGMPPPGIGRGNGTMPGGKAAIYRFLATFCPFGNVLSTAS